MNIQGTSEIDILKNAADLIDYELSRLDQKIDELDAELRQALDENESLKDRVKDLENELAK